MIGLQNIVRELSALSASQARLLGFRLTTSKDYGRLLARRRYRTWWTGYSYVHICGILGVQRYKQKTLLTEYKRKHFFFSRRITIAEYNHITFKEYLPVVMGEELVKKHSLNPGAEGPAAGYIKEVNPGILNSFAVASYRNPSVC